MNLTSSDGSYVKPATGSQRRAPWIGVLMPGINVSAISTADSASSGIDRRLRTSPLTREAATAAIVPIRMNSAWRLTKYSESPKTCCAR